MFERFCFDGKPTTKYLIINSKEMFFGWKDMIWNVSEYTMLYHFFKYENIIRSIENNFIYFCYPAQFSPFYYKFHRD
jgi:hypothetical protein